LKEFLTAFDIAILSRELDSELTGYYIDNIYQVNPFTLLLKLNKPGEPPKQLVLQSGRRAHLTGYKLKKPKTPSVFCSALRKYLINAKIQKIEQYDFERLISLTASKAQQTYQLIVELFSKGNIVLLEAGGRVLHALSYRRMKDRDILRDEVFAYPKPSGLDPRIANRGDLAKLREVKGAVVRALTRLLAVGGLYAEEFLFSAGIDKNKESATLTDEELDRLYVAISDTVSRLEHVEPSIVFDEAERPLDVLPFPLKIYSALPMKRYPSLNAALDEYFTSYMFEKEAESLTTAYESRVAEHQRILAEQTSKLTELKSEVERNRHIGELIHRHVYDLQRLIDGINHKRERGAGWAQIEEEARIKGGAPPFHIFLEIDPAEQKVKVKVEDSEFQLELKKSIYENASLYYQRSKWLQGKAKSVEKALEETRKKIESIRREESSEEALEPQRLPEKKWYEKYHYFTSSEGFLVVGGKDAASNEALIKRYTETEDLVVHADVAGSPFVVVKTENRKPSEATLAEAAQLAVSHSRAWREGLGSADAYWIKPNQVSKKAPSGEYIARGAFMIYGERNYLHKVPLVLAIGIKINGEPKVVAAPPTAVKAITAHYLEILPGDIPAKDLAAKIKAGLTSRFTGELRNKILKIPLETFTALIPFGRARLAFDSKLRGEVK